MVELPPAELATVIIFPKLEVVAVVTVGVETIIEGLLVRLEDVVERLTEVVAFTTGTFNER